MAVKREKKPRAVITFPTTSAAMAFEGAARTHDIPGRTIPVPSAVSAGCGFCWCCELAERDAVVAAAAEYALEYEGVFEAELY